MSGRWSSWGWSDLCVENICWLVPFLTFFGLLTKSWTELRQPGTPGSSQGNELVIRQLHFINVQLKKTQVDERYDGPYFSLNCKIRDLDHIYCKPWSNIFLRISKEKLFLMNAVIDLPSMYPTAGQTSQSKEKDTSPNWFIYWSASEVTKYIILLISCAQRYSDDRIDTIVYRYSGNRMDTVIFQGFLKSSQQLFWNRRREIWFNYELY